MDNKPSVNRIRLRPDSPSERPARPDSRKRPWDGSQEAEDDPVSPVASAARVGPLDDAAEAGSSASTEDGDLSDVVAEFSEAAGRLQDVLPSSRRSVDIALQRDEVDWGQTAGGLSTTARDLIHWVGPEPYYGPMQAEDRHSTLERQMRDNLDRPCLLILSKAALQGLVDSTLLMYVEVAAQHPYKYAISDLVRQASKFLRHVVEDEPSHLTARPPSCAALKTIFDPNERPVYKKVVVSCAASSLMGRQLSATQRARLLLGLTSMASLWGMLPADLPGLLWSFLCAGAEWEDALILHDGILAASAPAAAPLLYAPFATVAWAAILSSQFNRRCGWVLAALGDVEPGYAGLAEMPRGSMQYFAIAQPPLSAPTLTRLQQVRNAAFVVQCQALGIPTLPQLRGVLPNDVLPSSCHRVVLTAAASQRYVEAWARAMAQVAAYGPYQINREADLE